MASLMNHGGMPSETPAYSFSNSSKEAGGVRQHAFYPYVNNTSSEASILTSLLDTQTTAVRR